MRQGSCFACKNYGTLVWRQPCCGCFFGERPDGWERDHWWKTVWRYLRWLFRRGKKEDG